MLFMELIQDGDKTAEFVNGIVPQGMVEEAEKLTMETGTPAAIAGVVNADQPTEGKRVVTPKEVEEMEPHEFAELKNQINSGLAMIKG